MGESPPGPSYSKGQCSLWCYSLIHPFTVGFAILGPKKHGLEDGPESKFHQFVSSPSSSTKIWHSIAFAVFRLEEDAVGQDGAVGTKDDNPVAVHHTSQQHFYSLQVRKSV